MILSIIATVAVLAAIAVMAAALLLAETTLVYVALGLGAVSALLLVGAVVQGRFGGGGPNRERSGTDGLGKSSVPATAPAQYERSDEWGRAPAPAQTPVGEVSVPPGRGTGPVAERTGPEESERHAPRGETPASAAWPDHPDTADPVPSWEERSTAMEPPEHDTSAAESAPVPPGEEDPSARFSYRIPARPWTAEDDSAPVREETNAPAPTFAEAVRDDASTDAHDPGDEEPDRVR
ncbi:hypothetical protein BJF83_00325 [Nocardiopsis sp. CNR-923]|uniref:hypothetical protein n=1 Tax=Nocardiopsis sp. CNR-923 TaxID=1904965 RepID=UPI000963E74B|nr:hypothetical protein [Nocardiopsis sp. CNR-923]OLT29113.1 hypothetical protein BJF83_00325 [Nocardiopsis sp. CNR-923]